MLMLIALILSFGSPAFAQENSAVFVVSSPSAAVYLAPQENKKASTVLNRGRRVQVLGPAINGYLPISTRSGARAFIRTNDVTPQIAKANAKDIDNDIVEPTNDSKASAPNAPVGEPAARRASTGRKRESRSSPLGLEKLTFDLGGSFGSIGNTNYSEFNLGLNAYVYDWLAWRNALFARFATGYDTIYGLDSSVRGIFSLSGGIAGFTIFAGPGFRFVNKGSNVPFAEAGLVLKLIGIAIGGGVKVLLNSWAISGAPNDTQYFIILSGGGSL
jgi:hypothetical protein